MDSRKVIFNGPNADSFINDLIIFKNDFEYLSNTIRQISEHINNSSEWKDFGHKEMMAYMKLVTIYTEMLVGSREPGGNQFNDFAKAESMDKESHIVQMIDSLKEFSNEMERFVKTGSNRDECFTWLDRAQ